LTKTTGHEDLSGFFEMAFTLSSKICLWLWFKNPISLEPDITVEHDV
jgi:hypothetical protein